MAAVVVRPYPQGRRVWVFGQRLHHGTVGLVLTLLGVALAAHDRRDWRCWLAREGCPSAS